MRFQKQAFKHDPANGVFGDCQRTVLACMLDLDRDSVPNFGIHMGNVPAWHKMLDGWLESKGYVLVETPFQGDSVEAVLYSQSNRPNLHYLFSGSSANGTNHVVIARGDKIVWDTAIDNSGIVGPDDQGYYWVGHLVQTRFVSDPADEYCRLVDTCLTMAQGICDGSWNRSFKNVLDAHGLCLSQDKQVNDRRYLKSGPHVAVACYGDIDGWPRLTYIVFKDKTPA